jgi:hypothetical protein
MTDAGSNLGVRTKETDDAGSNYAVRAIDTTRQVSRSGLCVVADAQGFFTRATRC